MHRLGLNSGGAVCLQWMLLALIGGSSGAQAAEPSVNFQTYRPTAVATKISAEEAPTIDGKIDDTVWAKAKPIDDFYQVEPKVGTAPSFRTEARILFDEDHLYVSFRAYDPEPSKIARAMMTRDGQLWKDDVVRFAIDSQNNGRHGYSFEISSGGARFDGLIQNNSDVIGEWNTIWHGHSKIDDQGWTAEFAIPFRSISFAADAKDWGFNMGRTIRRLDQPVRWSNISNSIAYMDMSKSGRLTGISGVSQGLGLDVEVLGGARYKYEWDDPRQGDLTFEPSANLYYKVTPSLTGTLTFNTDFSDAPLDARQVNTGRFGLFIPESRDFFLQDASLFEFGGQGLAESPNGRPFFSRNIGITDFGVADIIAGGKLSGSLFDANVAGLVVKTAGLKDRVAEKTLAAMRVSVPVFGRSQIGAIFTAGDPSDDEDNALAGFDVQIRDNSLLDGRALNADFYFQRTNNEGVEDDAFGFEISSYEDDWAWWLNGKQLGADFDPGLGFVNRTDFRRISYGTRRRFRPESEWLRFFQFEAGGQTIWTLDNHLDTREIFASAGLNTLIGDELFVSVSSTREDIPDAFFLPDGVEVPADVYDNWNVGLYLGSSRARWYAGNLNIDYGQLYGGDYFHVGVTVDLRPSPYVSFDLRHDFQEFKLPAGSVRIHVDSIAMNVNITPDMTVTLQSEYDNISSEIGLSSRLRWEFVPGGELFASIGQAAFVEGRDITSRTTTGALRVGHTFRF